MRPEDICNQALAEVGFARPIGDLFEGTPAAIVGLEIYAQTRDEALRAKDWPFARKTAPLTLIKEALVPPVGGWDETQPPPPWRFVYGYPADCIYLRYLRANPYGYEGGDPFEPVPVRFTIGSDAAAPGSAAAKVILSDLESPLGIYTARVTDPAQWEPLFLAGLVKVLATKFSVRLGQVQQGAAELVKEKATEAAPMIAAADMRQE